MYSTPFKTSGGGSGLYAWKQYALGGNTKTFEKYVTANSPDKYPLGGMKNGKLYIIVDLTFEQMTWQQVNEIVHGGYADQVFSLGDEKTITLSTGEIITVEVAGFNHDDYTGGGKAPVSFIMTNCLKSTRVMNTASTNVGGWDASELRTFVNGTLFGQLPADLKALIKPINKVTSIGNQSSTLKTSSDSLWLLSEIEAFGSTSYSPAGEGTLYPIFTDNASRIKKVGSSAGAWWLRSPYLGGAAYFCSVYSSGSRGYYSASNSYGVAAGFCI